MVALILFFVVSTIYFTFWTGFDKITLISKS